MANNKTQYTEAGKASIIIIIIILLVIGVMVLSNFFGPGKGWIDELVKGKAKEEKVVEPAPIPEPQKPAPPVKEVVIEEPGKPEPEKKEEKSEIQKLYDSLFEKYRQKFPDPEIGKTYDVYLNSGTVQGKLKEFSDGKIVIQKTGVTVTYRIDTVSKKSYPQLFPKKAAKILALKEMKKILDDRAAAEKTAEKEQEYTVVENKASGSAMPSPQGSANFAYEPESQPTPDRLKKPLAAFGEWIKVQQRRVGGKMGEKIYAKQQGRNVVLYMETSNLFRKQDYDTRFTCAEGMWQIWGFKCLDYGVARATSQTHIVLLDNNNKIIGGSTKDDSSNIWVKK